MAASVIDEEVKLRLGGYLVCELVDCRFRFEEAHQFIRYWIQPISQAMQVVFDAPSSEVKFIHMSRAEVSLEKISLFVDLLPPRRQREFLLPIYVHCAELLNCPQLQAMLELLCDQGSIVWKSARMFCHGVRHALSDVGGVLADIGRYLDELKRTSPYLLSDDMNGRREYLLQKLSSFTDTQRERCNCFLSPACGAMFEAYEGTPYHVKAVDVMQENISKRLNRMKESERKGRLLAWLDHLVTEYQEHSSPQITPFVWLLRSSDSQDTIRMLPEFDDVEPLRINDMLISDLREQILKKYGD